MARIAFILLGHRDPEALIRQARLLASAGDGVALHYDARAPAAEFARLEAALAGDPSVILAGRRHRCGWGEWSLVAATLATLRAALAGFADATHFHLVSGDCWPIRSAAEIRAALDAEEADLIESVDFFSSGWIRTGLREERLIYRHWFNERTRRRTFYAAMAVQRRLGLSRRVPAGLEMRIGSQWWCLRRRTVEAVLAFADARPDILRFFRSTWIPDETFFQTVAASLVPASEVRAQPPTFALFTDYGLPVVFCDDHHDLLVAQPQFFARKISPEATDLRRRLGRRFAGAGAAPPRTVSGMARLLALREAGRRGGRCGPRIWERGASVGAEADLVVVICKRWDVANRLLDAAARASGRATFGYVFDDAAVSLPDLGGIERGLAKRNRHRRAVLRLLREAAGTDRLAIGLDPAGRDAARDLAGADCRTRLLLLDLPLPEGWLSGHAARLGRETVPHALAALRGEIAAEHARLAALPGLRVLDGAAGAEAAAAVLAEAFEIAMDAARAIAQTRDILTTTKDP